MGEAQSKRASAGRAIIFKSKFSIIKEYFYRFKDQVEAQPKLQFISILDEIKQLLREPF